MNISSFIQTMIIDCRPIFFYFNSIRKFVRTNCSCDNALLLYYHDNVGNEFSGLNEHRNKLFLGPKVIVCTNGDVVLKFQVTPQSF